MSTSWFPYFFDELEKLGVRLTKGEEREQALQFAGLGAVAIPSMSAVQSKMQTGKWVPAGIPGKTPLSRFGRWLPGAAATGLFWGGALPTIQHALARKNIEKAKARRAGQKALELARPREVEMATTPNTIPVLPKTASEAGQDLRLPVMGGTKFPTGDSKVFANKQLRMSSAEVGPVQPSTRGAKLEDVIPQYDPVKKAGDIMDPMATDPLVQYLKKQAAQQGSNNKAADQPPTKGLVNQVGQFKDNEPDMPLGKAEAETSSEPPQPTPEMEAKVDIALHEENLMAKKLHNALRAMDRILTQVSIRIKNARKEHLDSVNFFNIIQQTVTA